MNEALCRPRWKKVQKSTQPVGADAARSDLCGTLEYSTPPQKDNLFAARDGVHSAPGALDVLNWYLW
jgi:hypothetical protein